MGAHEATQSGHDHETRDAYARTRLFTLGLAFITSWGVGFRLMKLPYYGQWVDETITLDFVSNNNPLELWWVIPAKQPHLPLYYSLLDVWLHLTGFTELNARLLSIITGALGIIMLGLLAAYLWDGRAGLFAASLYAMSPMHIYLDQTIRMYSLLSLTTITSWYCLFHLANRDGNQRLHTIGYILSAGAAAWLHYFGAFTIASHLIAALYWHHKRDHSHLLPALAGGFLLALPSFATTAYYSFVVDGGQAQRMITHTDDPPGIRKLGVIVARLLVQRVNNTAEVVSVALALGAVGYTLHTHHRRLELAGITAWFWTPLVLMVVVSWLVHPADGARYIIACSPGLLLAYTYSVRELLPRWLHATAAIITIGLWSSTLWLFTNSGSILT